MDDAHRKAWRDFKFTVDVILSAALAQEDLAEAQTASSAASLRFNLLAASTIEEPALPTVEWRDSRQLVSASLVENAGELRVTFQALGYAALTRLAGRPARVVSADGEIEIAFRFNSEGRGGRGCSIYVDANGPTFCRCIFNLCLAVLKLVSRYAGSLPTDICHRIIPLISIARSANSWRVGSIRPASRRAPPSRCSPIIRVCDARLQIF